LFLFKEITRYDLQGRIMMLSWNGRDGCHAGIQGGSCSFPYSEEMGYTAASSGVLGILEMETHDTREHQQKLHRGSGARQSPSLDLNLEQRNEPPHWRRRSHWTELGSHRNPSGELEELAS
jgi:hypothetical protein